MVYCKVFLSKNFPELLTGELMGIKHTVHNLNNPTEISNRTSMYEKPLPSNTKYIIQYKKQGNRHALCLTNGQ